MFRLLLALVFAGSVCWTARAAPPPPAADDDATLGAEGKRALLEKRFDDARSAFAGLLERAADPAERWQALIGLGLSHHLARQPVAAHDWFTRFVAETAGQPLAATPPWPARIAEIGATVAQIEAVLLASRASLRVRSQPDGAQLQIDGPETAHRGTTPFRGWLPPGRFVVHVAASDHRAHQQTVVLVAGEERAMDVTLERAAAPPDPPDLGIIEPVGPPPASGPPIAGWLALGVGAAALGTGVAFTALALGDQDELERLGDLPGTVAVQAEYDRTKERMQEREIASWVCYGAGAAALAAGLYLLLEAPAADAPVVQLVPLPGGAATGVSTRF